MGNPFEEIDARLSNIEALLLDIKHGPLEVKPPTELPEFLTVKEAAIFLRLSVPTIYALISKNLLPVMKRSQRCYFLRSDLIQYLKEGRKKTIAEIKKEADQFIEKKKGA